MHTCEYWACESVFASVLSAWCVGYNIFFSPGLFLGSDKTAVFYSPYCLLRVIYVSVMMKVIYNQGVIQCGNNILY